MLSTGEGTNLLGIRAFYNGIIIISSEHVYYSECESSITTQMTLVNVASAIGRNAATSQRQDKSSGAIQTCPGWS